jgi:hypothetical protein
MAWCPIPGCGSIGNGFAIEAFNRLFSIPHYSTSEARAKAATWGMPFSGALLRRVIPER